jgi:hypothetical protein
MSLILTIGLVSAPSSAADPNRPNQYETPSLGVAGDAVNLSAAEQASIQKVIESQLAAFQREDALEAFTFASPGIQQRFGNPDNFIAMVRSSYRSVYRPLEVEFREIRLLNGQPAQIMYFLGPDGVPITAIYFMEKQPDGSWRIDGVYLVKQPEVGA